MVLIKISQDKNCEVFFSDGVSPRNKLPNPEKIEVFEFHCIMNGGIIENFIRIKGVQNFEWWYEF